MVTESRKIGLRTLPKIELILWGVALVAICWVYWPALVEMYDRWESDPRYSHGFLVPVFSLFLLWYRRDLINVANFQPSWWGFALITLGTGLKMGGGIFFMGWFDALSLIFMIGGLVLLAGGKAMLRWAWPAVAFLVFMIPLPYKIEYALGWPLQMIATTASTYALETLGLPAVAEGFTISMGETKIGVVEACNGLGMLVMFFAYATAAVFLIKRPWPDKAVILLSAIPIALGANIFRITLTGLMHETVGGEWANKFYHDLAGWLMMPMALAAFWLELKLLDWLFVEVEPIASEPKFSFVGGGSLKAKGVNPVAKPKRDDPS